MFAIALYRIYARRTHRRLAPNPMQTPFSCWWDITDLGHVDLQPALRILKTGTGAVYSFDPVGSYEREACRAAGAASSLIQPFLDNQVSSPSLSRLLFSSSLDFPPFRPLFFAEFPSFFPICVRVSTPHVRHMRFCASLTSGKQSRLETSLPY